MKLGSSSLGVFEGDGHVLLRSGQRLSSGHGCTAEVVALGIGDAPLAGLLADDEEPLVFVRQCEEGVGTGRDVQGSYFEVNGGDEGCGFVSTHPPDLSI